MTNTITKYLLPILCGFTISLTIALSVPAQPPPDVIVESRRKYQELTGVIRVQKEFGTVPAGPGNIRAAINPCAQFYVAALDPANRNRPILVADSLVLGREDGEYYTCKYQMGLPANQRFYVIAGMGSAGRLPEQTRNAMYITDAWIGGTNNKPPRGYERGFAGHFVTLGTVKATYLRFDLYYAQVDPN